MRELIEFKVNPVLEKIVDDKIIGFVQYHGDIKEVYKAVRSGRLNYYLVANNGMNLTLGETGRHLAMQEVKIARRVGGYVETQIVDKDSVMLQNTTKIYPKN